METRQPQLKFVCEFYVELATPIASPATANAAGQVSGRRRRTVPIVGGLVEGQRLRGRVIDGGADKGARAVFSKSFHEVDSNYAVRTHDGAVVNVRNFGLHYGPEHVQQAMARGEAIESPEHYLRTHPRFETRDPRYTWLNRLVAVGSGACDNHGLHLSIYEVV